MDPQTHRRMRTAHANHTHKCGCGRVVRGNGGWASHRWACPQYQAGIERFVAEHGHVARGDENVRRAPLWTWNADDHRWEKVVPAR